MENQCKTVMGMLKNQEQNGMKVEVIDVDAGHVARN